MRCALVLQSAQFPISPLKTTEISFVPLRDVLFPHACGTSFSTRQLFCHAYKSWNEARERGQNAFLLAHFHRRTPQQGNIRRTGESPPCRGSRSHDYVRSSVAPSPTRAWSKGAGQLDLCPPSIPDIRSLIAATHICRRWRTAALEFPSLWGNSGGHHSRLFLGSYLRSARARHAAHCVCRRHMREGDQDAEKDAVAPASSHPRTRPAHPVPSTDRTLSGDFVGPGAVADGFCNDGTHGSRKRTRLLSS
ncbi:hypothetical protein BD414DRAFT_249902 [Trametes punicea]|nr:hypothetical protein BD414DRAFT_249902 [Trametes punicea]